jgi:hypothetical protein
MEEIEAMGPYHVAKHFVTFENPAFEVTDNPHTFRWVDGEASKYLDCFAATDEEIIRAKVERLYNARRLFVKTYGVP